MIRGRALLLVCVLALAPGLAHAAEKTATFDYAGWHCARCGPDIEKALRKTKAVKSASASLDRVTVVYDDRFTDLDKLAAMIEGAGPFKIGVKRVVTPTPTPTPTPINTPTPPPPASP